MSIDRLGGLDPGRIGVFDGSLARQPANVRREVSQEVERLGFGSLWYGEALASESFVQAAIYLSATTRLVLASGISSIWVRDPITMSVGARSLAEAWPGRFILGLGVSHAPIVARRGSSYARPVSTMRQYLDRMGDAASIGPGVEMPPTVLAALGPQMVALAAERTAGAYPYFTTVDHIHRIREQLGPAPFLACDMPVVLASNRASARALGDPHMGKYLQMDNYRNNLVRIGWRDEDLEPPGSDQLFDSIIAWGDVDVIAQRVRARFEVGADHVILNIVTHDPSTTFLAELHALSRMVRAEL